MENYDIAIVGAGPAGSTAALFAARAGLKTLLVDKSEFPRDKICGDAISGKSLNILKQLSLTGPIEKIPQVRANGVIFSSPKGEHLKIKFRSADSSDTLHGYVCRRIEFDRFMFEQARKEVDRCYTGFRFTGLLKKDNHTAGITGIPPGESAPLKFQAKVVIAADGYKSAVARELGQYAYNSRHMLVALRAYFKNVKGMSDFIEIHFVKSALPGYFWIFPLDNGMANVGIGMRHLDIKKHNIDLQQVLRDTIRSPQFAPRFAEARLTEKIKGWNLPTGSYFRPNYSDGVLFIGDAAGLVDPFTGEGIGNAMTSAKIAVNVAAEAIRQGNTGKAFLAEYHRRLKAEIGSELALSYQLQKIGTRFPFLLNLVIGKAVRKPQISEWLSTMIADEKAKQDLSSPLTYLRLLVA
ncbi:MAG: NAD(P)/FAD-dependent oxidoreductase [Calditrichia bacterium]